jgi:uncharacterized protein YecT (DUF1311 family)
VHPLTLLTVLIAPCLAIGAEINCDDARTTLEINECVARQVDQAEADMNRYLDAAKKAHAEDGVTISALEEAQKAWELYRDSHCDAIYALNREGSIRASQMLSCKLELTRQRAHDLWGWYLGDQSELPEPERQY